ncbi:MAG TPA: hypothetical protein P5121_03495 [Caldilineaceae bacterium]|nr:hypothetical protein [Caldilineaceae bacterium]
MVQKTLRRVPKLVVLGVGTAIFGTDTLATLIRSAQIRGAALGLCDINGAIHLMPPT